MLSYCHENRDRVKLGVQADEGTLNIAFPCMGGRSVEDFVIVWQSTEKFRSKGKREVQYGLCRQED